MALIAEKNCGRLWGVMPQKKVRFDQFELDYGRFQLSRGGTPVRLEALPLQLLMLLIDSPNSLVTREQIAEKLWGKQLFVDIEQGINTAIRKIRIALNDGYVQPRFLRTVVGKGYCFVGQITIEQDSSESSEQVMFSAEELGRAVMAAAGLDPNNPRGSRER
jgi:DNA-binding winged helix-turn-helix (wHTH) protein